MFCIFKFLISSLADPKLILPTIMTKVIVHLPINYKTRTGSEMIGRFLSSLPPPLPSSFSLPIHISLSLSEHVALPPIQHSFSIEEPATQSIGQPDPNWTIKAEWERGWVATLSFSLLHFVLVSLTCPNPSLANHLCINLIKTTNRRRRVVSFLFYLSLLYVYFNRYLLQNLIILQDDT